MSPHGREIVLTGPDALNNVQMLLTNDSLAT